MDHPLVQPGVAGALPTIAGWLSATTPPDEVWARARMILLDTLGCAIAGWRQPEPAAYLRRSLGLSRGAVALPGIAGALSPQAAAYALGMGAFWDDACEGSARAHGRPGVHAVAAALPLALAMDAPLDRLLGAIIAGYEIGGRIAEACRVLPGMHADGATGFFAAAAAAAWMIDPAPEHVCAAIRVAACQMPFSLYLPLKTGDATRSLYVGHAASAAIDLAVAAAAGIGAPSGALDSMYWLALGGGDGLTLAPAGDWMILEGYIKPFAGTRHLHYGAAAAQIWRDAGGDHRRIQAIALQIYREAITQSGLSAPERAIQAQNSLSWGVAWALVHGDLGPAAFAPAGLIDPDVRRLESLVTLFEDEARSQRGARGARLIVVCDEVGQYVDLETIPGEPMTMGDVVAKFMRYASSYLPLERAAMICRRVVEGDPAWPLTLG